MRRRFHGSFSTGSNSMLLRECKPGSSCVGRLHFYPLADDDADALFEIIDAHRASVSCPTTPGGDAA